MSPEQFQKADEIFRGAVKLQDSAREAFVASACGVDRELRDFVETLLVQDADPRVAIDSPVADVVRALGDALAEASDESVTHPERIGAYRILRQLGEGGFGVVYLAEQERPKRTVALKVLRADVQSPNALRRFEYEAQILGRLQHPGIAQIFEAGVAGVGPQRQAYFAMEYIRGRNLLAYAEGSDDQRTGLSVPARLELFCKVCDAVQHAHQNGVIHRDIKPDNILVREGPHSRSGESSGSGEYGQPKILDFGVARVTEADNDLTLMRTGAGQLIGTLAYMSPEQVTGDSRQIDTRCDVYALGVVLCQLLTGELPYDIRGGTFHDAILTITQQTPALLGTINRSLRGDIEAIVAKTLEKDKDRRYQSAADLAADIRRHLAGEPIQAKRDSALYVLRKRIRQYRVAMGAAAVFTVIIAASIVALGLSYKRQGVLLSEVQTQRDKAVAAEAVAATRLDEANTAREAEQTARSLAETEADKSGAVNAFLQDMLGSANPAIARGEEPTVREILDQAATKVEAGSLSDEPEVEAAVRTTLGTTYLAMGLLDEAYPHLKRAMEIVRARHDSDHVEVSAATSEFVRLLNAMGEVEEAETLGKQVLEMDRRLHGDRHQDVAIALNNLAYVYLDQGMYKEAAERLGESIAIFRELPETDSTVLAASLDSLGMALTQLDELKEAEKLHREALDIYENKYGELHPDTAACLNNLGIFYAAKKDNENAERYYRRALEARRKLYGDNNIDVATTMHNLAVLVKDMGRPDEAEALFRESIDIMHKTLKPDHFTTATALFHLIVLLRAENRMADAEPLCREYLQINRTLLENPHHNLGRALNLLGLVLMDLNRPADAEPMFRESLEVRMREYPDGHRLVATTQGLLGKCLLDLDRSEEAQPFLVAAQNGLKDYPEALRELNRDLQSRLEAGVRK